LLPRLEEVFALYRKHATASKATVRQNIHAVELLLARFHEEPAGRLRLDVLTEGLPAKFQAAFVAERGEDREARARALRSSASLFNQAKSLFARALLPVYRDAGLVIPPSIESFCRARVNKGRGQARQAASDSVVQATFERIHALKEADPEVFKAFWLVAGAGLRKGELGRLTWGQLRQVDGRWAVGGGIGKDGQPILVFLQERAVKALGLNSSRRKAAEGGQDAHHTFLRGSAHERGDQVPRRLNAFLRGCGWSNRKAMHDLRAWVGSKLFEADPGAAQVFLRHKDLTTTQKSYTHHARVKAVPSVI
jgi:integrase